MFHGSVCDAAPEGDCLSKSVHEITSLNAHAACVAVSEVDCPGQCVGQKARLHDCVVHFHGSLCKAVPEAVRFSPYD